MPREGNKETKERERKTDRTRFGAGQSILFVCPKDNVVGKYGRRTLRMEMSRSCIMQGLMHAAAGAAGSTEVRDIIERITCAAQKWKNRSRLTRWVAPHFSYPIRL